MYWLAGDVGEAVEVAVAVAAAACALVVAREGAAAVIAVVVAVIAEVVALAADTAVLDARRRCRARLVAHRRSIDRPHDAQVLGRTTVICRRLAVGPEQALETDRVVVWPGVGRVAPVDPAQVGLVQAAPAPVLARVPVLVPAADHWQAVAAFHRIAICRTSSICHPVAAWVAQIGHRLGLADLV
ncbi:MAG TPA: hypothetical protein VJ828_08840 [Lacipirellulaceae bacterium]|nr:hypothetical protein [Lacipirellulaceae bacterium]